MRGDFEAFGASFENCFFCALWVEELSLTTPKKQYAPSLTPRILLVLCFLCLHFTYPSIMGFAFGLGSSVLEGLG